MTEREETQIALDFTSGTGSAPPWREPQRGRTAASGASGEERLARVALTRLVEPGTAAVGRWLSSHSAVELIDLVRTGAALPELTLDQRRLTVLRQRLALTDPVADLERLRAIGGRFLVPTDAEWPSQLADLADSQPIGLWVLGTGSLRLLALRSVALVGARACTAYGAHVATELAAALAERGWVVCSGAAYGIDAAAHRGALAVGGMTVAVLACGVDVRYPRGNSELIGRIAEQGQLVSELPPGEHPNRFRFVLRNRVLAAMTRGTVVVEAAVRSGALSTARRAQELNRHTMGVCGPVTSELSAGVHALIRGGGATLVTDAAEVAEQIGSIGADLAPLRSSQPRPRDLLHHAAALVLEAIPGGPAGAPIGDLALRTGLPADQVRKELYELCSLGFVQRAGSHWRVIR
ncbi:DNA-processing protein DprA [Kitasatospora kifunensis]|uniref:DNA processing protein n=1 Tax=Kitasatospora kifunensis TaxID=58351 RepID=A0A7W7R1Z4_KITKI|nr:DNA-processing protein DprA [Kitasatospora kifunensis]MBB4923336.1 DNA processing protein [Kitasatospora kifunensis]